jgi:hypothetical protein
MNYSNIFKGFKMKRILVFFTLFFTITNFSLAQIAVTPLALFVDNVSRAGDMTIFNQGTEPKEISIRLNYGYIDYDSTGKSLLNMDDTITSKANSISPYITIYPKKLIIQPGTSQTVKFMVKNTNSLSDGTYWTRIVTESKDIKKQIDSTNRGDKVSVGLSIKFNMVSAFIFQKGKLNTKVNLNSLTIKTDSSKVNLLLDFSREGNSPFFGTSKITIYDNKGDEVKSTEETFAAYFKGIKAFAYDKELLKPGNYKAEIILTNDQPDVPDDRKVPFDKMKKTFEFKVE